MEKTGQRHKLKQVEVRLKLISKRPLYSDSEIQNPADAVAVMADAMASLDREFLCVVNLDAVGHPLNFNVVSIGDVQNTFASMQSLFKSAVLSNASSLLAIHNHCSGSAAPSGLDLEVTKRMIAAGKIMNIPVVDHIVIGGGTGCYYSFREQRPDLFQGNGALAKVCNEENGGAQMRQGHIF